MTTSETVQPQQLCHKHPHAMAEEVCPHCDRPICEYCLSPVGGLFLCRECARSVRRKGRLMKIGIVIDREEVAVIVEIEVLAIAQAARVDLELATVRIASQDRPGVRIGETLAFL